MAALPFYAQLINLFAALLLLLAFAMLTQRRVRGTWNPTNRPTSQWPRFTEWFADRVFHDHADVVRVTFGFARVTIVDGEPRDTGTTAFEVERGRP